MGNNTYLTINKTIAIRGISAIAILVFHILIGLNISPIFNLWGGMFVAVFLILSGYGINESYHHHGLSNYWHKRFTKVIIPTFVFASCFHLLYPKGNLQTWYKEIFYITPTYWFIFHIIKCYLVYWTARYFFRRHWIYPMLLWAILCLNYRFCNTHLESEQAFSFFIGVLLSEYKDYFNRVSKKRIHFGIIALFLTGLFFYGIKIIPAVHSYIGTITYNYLLCPFRLSWALTAIYILTQLPIHNNSTLLFSGKKSLELYIAHIPFLFLITNLQSVLIFISFSAISFSLLLFYTTRMQQKISLSMALYMIVNALFTAKYSCRVFPVIYPYITLTVITFHYIFISYILPNLLKYKKTYRLSIFFSVCCFIIMLVLQYHINPYSLNVDRWSALYFPIKNLLHGIYPYIAQTHLGGNASPFPIWQIFHIPFYTLGNVGLSFFFVLALFLWSIYHQWGTKSFVTISMLIIVSPAIWYEVAVRSDFITNILLLATTINVFIYKVSLKWMKQHILWIGIAIAMFASTRIITLIPIAILIFPFYLKLPISNKIYLVLVFIVAFIFTFLPFALWDWQDFFYHQNNPWTLQTRQGNMMDFILFIPLAIILSIKWNGNIKNYYTYVSFMLISFVGITLLHQMYNLGNWDLFSSSYDITYFDSILPFAMIAIGLEKMRSKLEKTE